MPSRTNANFARPADDVEFEHMIRDICAEEWCDSETKLFGRSGQKQYGVDVFGQPIDLNGRYRAAQCKLRTQGRQLTKQEIEKEVNEATQFEHDLDMLVIATDAPRDTHTELAVNKISEAQQALGGFRVVIWFWDDITDRLSVYPHLILRYYRDYFSIITTSSITEALIESALCIHHLVIGVEDQRANEIEEAIRFRGLRTFKRDLASKAAKGINAESVEDGVLIDVTFTEKGKSSPNAVLYTTTNIMSYANTVDPVCPILVTVPSDLIGEVSQALDELEITSHRVTVLDRSIQINDIADTVFQRVFDFGYARRGAINTVDVAVRTMDGSPGSVLLDLDWRSRLGPSRLPSEDEWISHFMPALMALKRQVLNQSADVRSQFISQLQVPAAFALGFTFNIREARIGIWARKLGVSDFRKQYWLSDGEATDVFFPVEWVKPINPHQGCHSAIVELTTYKSIHAMVQRFAKEQKIHVDAWLQIPFEPGGSSSLNIVEGDALAYANQVARSIRELNEASVVDIHMFARIPSALAILIGQRLHACGRIHVYWYRNPNYQYAFQLS